MKASYILLIFFLGFNILGLKNNIYAQIVKKYPSATPVFVIDGNKIKKHGTNTTLFILSGNNVKRVSDNQTLYTFDGRRFRSKSNNKNIFILEGNKIKSPLDARTLFEISGGIIKRGGQGGQKAYDMPLMVNKALVLTILAEEEN